MGFIHVVCCGLGCQGGLEEHKQLVQCLSWSQCRDCWTLLLSSGSSQLSTACPSGPIILFLGCSGSLYTLGEKLHGAGVPLSVHYSPFHIFLFKASSFLPEHLLYSMDELFQVIQKLMLAEIKKSPTMG